MAKKVSRVIYNDEVLMDISQDSVSEETLKRGETAHDSAGEGIVGNADMVDGRYYKIDDPASTDLADSDYLPFYDVSDEEVPKKKTLFSSIIEKLKSVFLTKKVGTGNDELVYSTYYLGYKDNDIDATKADNNVSSPQYPSTFRIMDKNERNIVVTEGTVEPTGEIGWKSYVKNYDTNGNAHGPKGMRFNMNKSGNLTYTIGDYDDFRRAIKTMDQIGTSIVSNSDLNNYQTGGTYYVINNGTAETISNIPIANSGKLIVLEIDINDGTKRQEQIYITNTNITFMRHRDYSGSWSVWKRMAVLDDISPSQVGDGYAEATVSGTTITATITDFQLRVGVIVAIRIPTEISSACTLNINNTGAKSVSYWDNESPSKGKTLPTGQINLFMYDGTYYRVIGFDRTASVHAQSYVAGTSGNVVIGWGYGTDRAQIKHNIFNGRLSYNYLKNGSWRGDKQLIDETGGQNMRGWLKLPAGSGVTIASGAHSVAVQDTIPNILNELRFSNGAWGSFNLGTAYTLGNTTISTGWYNYFYIPHRVGGENWDTPTSWNADNVNYGSLLLYGMNNTNGMFRIRMKVVNDAATVDELEDLQKGNIYVGTCTTAADQQAKVATVDGNFVLRKGVRVAIKFSNTNTFSSQTSTPITLNVNGTGAKNIYYNTTHSGAGNTGTNTRIYGIANRYVFYVYDGTYWVWDSYSCDDNSTGYLPNNNSATLTAIANNAWIKLKSSDIDLTKDDNDVTAIRYPAYIATDKNDRIISRLESVVEPSGMTWTYLQVRNYKTSDGTNPNAGIKVGMDKTGAVKYTVSQVTQFNLATGIGYGTCDTAADQQVKEVTCAGYVLATGGIIHVKFTNTNTFSSQTSTPIQLNVNGTGAKNIWYSNNHSGAGNTGTSTRIYGEAGRIFSYMYNGTYWVWLGCGYESDTTDPRALGFGYGTCSTAESTTEKAVTLSSYTLRNGGFVSVKFTNAVPANATMNINTRGAKAIYFNGSAIKANIIGAGNIATFVYDGTNYHLISVDRTLNLSDNYTYNDSAGRPSGLTFSDTDVQITQLTRVIRGDLVTINFNLKFPIKNYTANTKIITGFPIPYQSVFMETQGRCFFLNTSGELYIRNYNFTSAVTLWGCNLTYIKKA